MFDLIDNAFAPGYDHIIKEGSRREDFGKTSKSKDGEPFFRIFAVADGHGDSNCPRSDFGSKVACDVVVSALEEFCKEVAAGKLESEVIKQGAKGPTNQERIDKGDRIRQLIAYIVSEWNDKVKANLNANPLTEDERAGCDNYIERYDRGERLEHIYGTTLIAGLLTDNYLLLLQQGDGRCDVFDSKGEVTQPIPWDDRCFANVTTSLCEVDATQRFRYCVIDVEKTPVIACIADSDGVEDSFASLDLLHNYHRELLIYACENGLNALHDHLDNTLPELSKNFSRDDVTICGFMDLEKVRHLVPDFKRTNERISLECRLRDINGRLKSMDSMGKMNGLKASFEKACEEVKAAQEALELARKRLKNCSEDRTKLQQYVDAESESLIHKKADKEKKEQEYIAYQEKRKALEKEKIDVQTKLNNLALEKSAAVGNMKPISSENVHDASDATAARAADQQTYETIEEKEEHLPNESSNS